MSLPQGMRVARVATKASCRCPDDGAKTAKFVDEVRAVTELDSRSLESCYWSRTDHRHEP